MPKFQQFSVTVETVKYQPIKISGKHNQYKTFLSSLKNQPINFAGHYVLDTYGCGGGCEGTGIYNAKTGVAFIHDEQFTECYSEKEGWRDRNFEVYPNSQLLVLTGNRTNKEAHCEKVYYLIERDQLKEIAKESLYTR